MKITSGPRSLDKESMISTLCPRTVDKDIIIGTHILGLRVREA